MRLFSCSSLFERSVRRDQRGRSTESRSDFVTKASSGAIRLVPTTRFNEFLSNPEPVEIFVCVQGRCDPFRVILFARDS